MQYGSASYSTHIENFSLIYNNIEKFTENNEEKGEKSKKMYTDLFSLGCKFINKILSLAKHSKIGLKTKVFIPNTHYDKNNLWLIKAPDLNRGRCIKIGNNLEKIKSIIKRFHEGILKDFKSEIEQENKEPESIYIYLN